MRAGPSSLNPYVPGHATHTHRNQQYYEGVVVWLQVRALQTAAVGRSRAM